MIFLKQHRVFILSFFLFAFLNIFLYFWVYFFYSVIPFNSRSYVANAHHYLKDPRIEHKQFNFLRGLGVFDAQWYLIIAEKGYPKHPKNMNNNDKNVMDGLMYNFFPLLPLLIRLANIFVKNIELAAFVVSNIFLLLNFISLYYVISKLHSRNLAVKTIFLLFVFPFSIFYRSYYTEEVRLFLFLWFSYFLMQRKYIFAAVSLSFLNITSGINFILDPVFIYLLGIEVKKKKEFLPKAIVAIILSLLPLFVWILFCYINTGDPFYFYKTRFAWFRPHIFPLLYNFLLFTSFFKLPFYSIYNSQIDMFAVITSLIILIKSRKILHPTLWGITLALWISPLLVQDTISYSRFEIVLFPLFIYAAHKLRKEYYFMTVSLSFMFLLFLSLFFVNWYWIE